MTNAYRRYQLTAGVYDSAALHGDTAKPRPSIMLSTCWTMGEKCEKNREREGGEGG